jgi:uncharacterized protein YndB with AHSA1/START domain
MTDQAIVNKSVFISAPASKVWQILTTPELIKEWVSDSGIEVSSDWQVGSPIRYSGTIHGIKLRDHGTILQAEPERVLSYTHWSAISHLPDRPENYSVIEFRLTPEADGTRLSVTQSSIKAKAGHEHWAFYWNTALYLIKLMAEQGVDALRKLRPESF